MDRSQRAALWVIATGVIAAGLYFLRDPLTQFALAMILWLSIDGFSRALQARVKILPKVLALPVAILVVLGLVTLIVYVIARNIGALATNAAGYEARLDQVAAQVWSAARMSGPAPTISDLINRVDPGVIVADIAGGVRAIASDTIFILIFLGFLFAAAQTISRKLDFIFPVAEDRERTREVLARIRISMERYLWVQTVVSLIITALTYVTLRVIGLDNALFWSFLIFFLNYIPTIGSIVATVLPTAFALAQFPTLGPVLAVAVGVGVWQFVVGNFLQPRMTGESLNLSAVVVLLALAIWGLIWGIAGAFLAAPLTVMLMIVLAQFPSTRWIAILLSADGKPTPET